MENTTGELILHLGEDVEKCHKNLIDAMDSVDDNGDEFDYSSFEFHARQLIRTIFAFIEALTFSVKAHGSNYCLENGVEISWAERYFSVDIDHNISNNGEVFERPAHIRLKDNVRFAFHIQEKALGIQEPFDANVEWWSCFRSSIKIRDRLTHPKLPGDINVTGDEVLDALKAYNGFKDHVMMYASLRKE